MNQYLSINGYCQTQKKNFSATLTCIDAGDGSYLKGTVDCDYVKHGGKCDTCSLRNDCPDQFR